MGREVRVWKSDSCKANHSHVGVDVLQNALCKEDEPYRNTNEQYATGVWPSLPESSSAVGARCRINYYVDVLWFGSLGYGDVFWKTLSLQWGIFTGHNAAD
jgi:hypothetical protein